MKCMTTISLLCPVLLLAGCANGGMEPGRRAHLTALQCRELTATKNGAPATRERNMGELAALEQAGYHPERSLEPNYPTDLQAAQWQVGVWFQEECKQGRPQ